MKIYKTAKAILRAALADIEEGRWCKKMLAKTRTKADEKFIEDYGYDQYVDQCTVLNDPIGCALGLVSMHGGLSDRVTIVDGKDENGKDIKLEAVEVRYAIDGDPPGVLKAIEALARAIPSNTERGRRAKAILADDDTPISTRIEDLSTVVFMYNDQKNMNQEKAADWFRRALEEA